MSELEQDRQTSGDSDSDLLRRSYLPGMVVTSLSRMREQETAEPSAVQIAIAESVERLEEQSDVTKLRREVESVASEGLWIGQYPPSAILLAYATRIFELDRAAAREVIGGFFRAPPACADGSFIPMLEGRLMRCYTDCRDVGAEDAAWLRELYRDSLPKLQSAPDVAEACEAAHRLACCYLAAGDDESSIAELQRLTAEGLSLLGGDPRKYFVRALLNSIDSTAEEQGPLHGRARLRLLEPLRTAE